MAKLPAKTGQDNPATSQRSEVLATRHVKPVAAMAGSFSRKVKSDPRNADAGEANQVKISFGHAPAGKQTWKGARSGYTSVDTPKAMASSPGQGRNTDNRSNSGEQKVKGKDLKRTPEAKQVAGMSGLSY